jgi:hypothetical protein
METGRNSTHPIIEFAFPPLVAIDERIGGNAIHQHVKNGYSADVVAEEFSERRVKGYLLKPTDETFEPVLAITNSAKAPADHPRALRMRELVIEDGASIGQDRSYAKWAKHPNESLIPTPPIDYEKRLQGILNSWAGAFRYLQEDRAEGTPGLREPQIGAVHAVHAHWAVSNAPATVVMPTGTGKTDVMISLLISKRCERLLVVVPTDALRTQMSEKFITLGILKEFGIVSGSARQPIVGVLKHRPKSIDEVDAFFSKCGVVVTTMSIAGQCSDDVQNRMAHLCPYLFIDEAHMINGAGAGGGKDSNDLANMLKPALSKGNIKVVASTTWDEYRKYFPFHRNGA